MKGQKDIFSTIKGRWDFVIAIVVIALVGYFLYSTAFKSQTTETPIVEVNADVSETAEPTIAMASGSSTKVASSSWTSEAPYRVSKVKRTGALDGNEDAEAKIITDYEVLETSAVATPMETIVETDEVVEEKSEPLPIEVEKLREEVKEEVVETETPEIEKSAPVIPEVSTPEPEPKAVTQAPPVKTEVDSKCAVIVGSFKNANNIVRVVDKLEEMGYAIVKGQTRPGLDYVGVPVACGDAVAQQELVRILNRTFDIEAWVKKK